jgi:hypothetical protein
VRGEPLSRCWGLKTGPSPILWCRFEDGRSDADYQNAGLR